MTVSTLLLFVGACASAPEEEPEEPDVDSVVQQEAQSLLDTITEYGLDEYESEEFESGDAAFSAGTANLVDDPEASAEDFRTAIGHFETVISEGFPALLEERQTTAEAVRDEALDARADVAAETLFTEADSLLEQAVTERADGSFEDSFASFNEATTQFAEARDTAAERRERAQAAIERASERLEESEARARELDEEVDDE